MRLALQALFTTTGANEEGTARRALLERKLRTNERSAGFFRRLRAAADDPTLGAPEIFAEESFPDANVVAEYLDGQAAPELARAYEDACWDSPEMLAEIGCCCDILNNDSLNAVVAPKNCRRRLYYIAWEEGAINVSSEKETPTLTTTLAPSDACVAQDEAEASDAIPLDDAKNAKVLTVKRSRVKRKRERKRSESVRSTLEAERSWRRRGKRWSARLALALSLLAVGYCGWQTLQEKPSETLELGTAKPKVENVEAGLAALESTEAPLRPTTISTSNIEELPLVSLAEATQIAQSELVDDWANDTMTENELSKLAALPNLTEGEANLEGPQPNAERRRVGLGGDEPWQSRPAIQIPAQNNDVFMKTQLY
ncbi:MAG: hypothetical protein IKK39_00970 [Thermoguttaceae bacterium]|nr:hypothetical protein [Thermoguttaceae bacterium]MBR4102618.1 hypothetical protein [Thermoguttaceae bacterium]